MQPIFQLLARRGSDAANQWLEQNPFVLFLLFAAIGTALLVWGVLGLKNGETSNKYGMKVEGGSAQVVSVLRIAGAVFCFGFAFYKLIF